MCRDRSKFFLRCHPGLTQIASTFWHTHICRPLITEGSLRLTYSGASPFPIALGSPFNPAMLAAIPASAALCATGSEVYLLFLNGFRLFHYYIPLCGVCQAPCQKLRKKATMQAYRRREGESVGRMASKSAREPTSVPTCETVAPAAAVPQAKTCKRSCPCSSARQMPATIESPAA